MFSDIKKQHLIVFFLMLAILFGGGVKYGLYMARQTVPPVAITEKTEVEKTEENNAKKPSEVVVHVAGAVSNPGVFTLKQGARTIDVVHMAKPQPQADLEGINLAKKLTDQEQVIIPYRGRDSGAQNKNSSSTHASMGKTGSGTRLININSAGESELETLPGIGPAKAKAITQYREENGYFASLEDIQKVPGIGPATFNNIKDQITI
jgi:competence protein ComEA